MNELYIYHHLGLGDHVSCHGIVRHYCEIKDKINLFVKPHNYQNVKRMYKDIKNLNLIQGDDNFVNQYISQNNISKNLLKIGFEKLNDFENIEYQFYKLSELPIEFKISKFFVERDYEIEKKIFNELNLKPKEYIFLHDGGFQIKEELLSKNLKIVKPEGYGLLDWMYVIENASEIHCIDSSFICLVDCMNTGNIPLNNHRYVRNYPENIKLHSNKNWNYIY
jgi:hypothetical protein